MQDCLVIFLLRPGTASTIGLDDDTLGGVGFGAKRPADNPMKHVLLPSFTCLINKGLSMFRSKITTTTTNTAAAATGISTTTQIPPTQTTLATVDVNNTDNNNHYDGVNGPDPTDFNNSPLPMDSSTILFLPSAQGNTAMKSDKFVDYNKFHDAAMAVTRISSVDANSHNVLETRDISQLDLSSFVTSFSIGKSLSMI